MTTEGLLTLSGDIAVLVAAQDSFILADLVRATKEHSGLIDTTTMDTNNDGIVNEEDIKIIRKGIFSSF